MLAVIILLASFLAVACGASDVPSRATEVPGPTSTSLSAPATQDLLGSTASPAPTTAPAASSPTPDSEPNREATVDALTGFWPTFEDYEAVILPKVSRLTDEAMEFALSQYDDYAGVYVARQCVEGREGTAEGFRAFVERTSGDLLPAIAETVIKEMVGIAERQIELGLSPVKEQCMRPYMYPEIVAEINLAAQLVTLVKQATTNEVSDASAAMLAVFMDAVREQRALEWFNLVVARGRPFLLWLCEPPNGSCELPEN